MKHILTILILLGSLFYLTGEETKTMNSYRQLYVNRSLNSYLRGDCLAQGRLKLKFQHTTDKLIRQNKITSLFLLRDKYIMLDIGIAGKLINLSKSGEERYYRKAQSSFLIYEDGTLVSFNGLNLQKFDEKRLDIAGTQKIKTKGATLELYYPFEDSYIIAASSPPIPGSEQFSFYIARREWPDKGGELLWEHDIEAGTPRPAVTGDKRIIIALPNKVVSCDFAGNLKTIYKDSFAPLSLSLGDDDSIYLVSLKKNEYYLTAFNSQGVRLWEQKLDIESYPTQPPIVSPNSMVYVIERTKIIAFRKGERLWDYPLAKDGYRDGNSQFATVLSDDTVLISDNNRVVYLNEFGEPIWIYKSEDERPFRTQPILDENGHVVVANDQDIVIIK